MSNLEKILACPVALDGCDRRAVLSPVEDDLGRLHVMAIVDAYGSYPSAGFYRPSSESWLDETGGMVNCPMPRDDVLALFIIKMPRRVVARFARWCAGNASIAALESFAAARATRAAAIAAHEFEDIESFVKNYTWAYQNTRAPLGIGNLCKSRNMRFLTRVLRHVRDNNPARRWIHFFGLYKPAALLANRMRVNFRWSFDSRKWDYQFHSRRRHTHANQVKLFYNYIRAFDYMRSSKRPLTGL